MEPKDEQEQLDEESQYGHRRKAPQECSETPKGRKALERWAKLQDESQGC